MMLMTRAPRRFRSRCRQLAALAGLTAILVCYQHGVDPKYMIRLIALPGPRGGTQLKPAQPLAPGEYGFVAVTRGQPNLVEGFAFGVD